MSSVLNIQGLKLALLAVLVLSATACSKMTTGETGNGLAANDGITGGSIVKLSDPLAKSVVGILQYSEDSGVEGYCSGTIVADDLVETAGHCVATLDDDESLYIYQGDYDPDNVDKSRMVKVDQFRLQPSFDLEADTNDIALLHLAAPLRPDHVVIKVLKDRKALVKGAALTVAGFGPPDTAGFMPMTLRVLHTKLDYVSGDQKVIASTNSTVFTDHGDSGGPALLNIKGVFWLVGSDCRFITEGSFLESFEDVSSHLSWLQSAAKAMGSKSQL